jgi:hypothetical protein
MRARAMVMVAMMMMGMMGMETMADDAHWTVMARYDDTTVR